MSKRRLRLILSVIASILILGYWGFHEPEYPLPPLPSEQAERQIDGFISGAVSVEYDEQGLPKQQLTSKRMTHYPVSDKTLLETPEVILFRQDRAPVLIQAEEGEVGPDNIEIFLRDQVAVVEQEPQGFSLETDYLRLVPDNDFAETDAAVTLRSKSGETKANGMKAYLAEDRLQLLEKVRGFYEPR